MSRTATPAQLAQAEVTQADVVELIKRLELEGFDPVSVLTGLSTALVVVVSTMLGDAHVPIWFSNWAAQTMHMGKGD